jgi:effector-binding domain-containing protein
VPVTVFVLVMPGPDLRLGHEARGRIAGTLLGIAIGVTIGVGVDAVPVRTTVALLGVLVAIGFADPRWLGAAGSTVAIVLMLDPAGTGVRVGEVRLAALVTGVALTAAGAGVLAWWLRHPATASRVRVLTGGAEEAEMTQDLTITHLPAEHALVLRLRVTLPTIGPSLGDGFGRVAGQAAAMGARIVGPPFAMYPEEPVGEFAVVVGFPIAPGTAVPAEGDGVELLDLPAADAVDVMFRGPYDGIGAAWGEIMAWMAANGRTMGAPCREVYLNSPDEVPPEGLLTRLLMPLA